MLQNWSIMDEFENFFQQKGQPRLGGFRDPAKNPGLGPGPERKIRKSWIRDRDSDLQDEGFRYSTLWDCPAD